MLTVMDVLILQQLYLETVTVLSSRPVLPLMTVSCFRVITIAAKSPSPPKVMKHKVQRERERESLLSQEPTG